MNIFSLITSLLAYLWSIIFVFISIVLTLVTFNRKLPLFLFRKLWAPIFTKITFINVSVEKSSLIDPSKNYIFTSNHQSFMDIPVICQTIGNDFYFILKKELKKAPFIGWFATLTDMVYIDRNRTNQANKSLEEAASKVKNGKSILIFPEGTRTETGQINKFKRGGFTIAKLSEVEIIPISIEGSRLAQPKNSFFINPAKIRIKYGDPISSKEFSQDDLRKITYFKTVELHKNIISEMIKDRRND
jgi:1-acyl-sn-glycerol-3-phosphate acyltransferase